MYQVWITDRDASERFLTNVGAHGARGELIPGCLAVLLTVANPNVDDPAAAWDQVREEMRERGIPTRELAVWPGNELLRVRALQERSLVDQAASCRRVGGR